MLRRPFDDRSRKERHPVGTPISRARLPARGSLAGPQYHLEVPRQPRCGLPGLNPRTAVVEWRLGSNYLYFGFEDRYQLLCHELHLDLNLNRMPRRTSTYYGRCYTSDWWHLACPALMSLPRCRRGELAECPPWPNMSMWQVADRSVRWKSGWLVTSTQAVPASFHSLNNTTPRSFNKSRTQQTRQIPTRGGADVCTPAPWPSRPKHGYVIRPGKGVGVGI